MKKVIWCSEPCAQQKTEPTGPHQLRLRHQCLDLAAETSCFELIQINIIKYMFFCFKPNVFDFWYAVRIECFKMFRTDSNSMFIQDTLSFLPAARSWWAKQAHGESSICSLSWWIFQFLQARTAHGHPTAPSSWLEWGRKQRNGPPWPPTQPKSQSLSYLGKQTARWCRCDPIELSPAWCVPVPWASGGALEQWAWNQPYCVENSRRKARYTLDHVAFSPLVPLLALDELHGTLCSPPVPAGWPLGESKNYLQSETVHPKEVGNMQQECIKKIHVDECACKHFKDPALSKKILHPSRPFLMLCCSFKAKWSNGTTRQSLSRVHL